MIREEKMGESDGLELQYIMYVHAYANVMSRSEDESDSNSD